MIFFLAQILLFFGTTASVFLDPSKLIEFSAAYFFINWIFIAAYLILPSQLVDLLKSSSILNYGLMIGMMVLLYFYLPNFILIFYEKIVYWIGPMSEVLKICQIINATFYLVRIPNRNVDPDSYQYGSSGVGLLGGMIFIFSFVLYKLYILISYLFVGVSTATIVIILFCIGICVGISIWTYIFQAEDANLLNGGIFSLYVCFITSMFVLESNPQLTTEDYSLSQVVNGQISLSDFMSSPKVMNNLISLLLFIFSIITIPLTECEWPCSYDPNHSRIQKEEQDSSWMRIIGHAISAIAILYFTNFALKFLHPESYDSTSSILISAILLLGMNYYLVKIFCSEILDKKESDYYLGYLIQNLFNL